MTMVLLGCSGEKPQGPRKTVRIGVMGPLTGPASGYGKSQLEGVRLAAETVNQGSGPFMIELVVVDDKANMSTAAELVVDLVYEHEVSAIIGAINSSVTHVVEMVAAKTQVPMITTTSTDPSITRTGTYWAFRCLADDMLQGKALAEQILDVDGHRNLAVFRQDNRYGKMGGQEIIRMATAKGHPPAVDMLFQSEEENFSEHIDAVRKANVQAIVIWGLYKPSGKLVKALRLAGIHQPIYGADGMVHPDFLKYAEEHAEGTVVTFPFDPYRDTPETRDFIQAYTKEYGHSPDSFAAHSYDALMIIAGAIQRGNCMDRECIKDNMLLTKGLAGVTGTITLDETGNDIREVELARVRDGEFIPLHGPGSNDTAVPDLELL